MTNLVMACVLWAVPSAMPETVVVCPSAWQGTLEPWVAYRRGQGHRITVIDNAGSAEDVRRRVLAATSPEALRFVLLVGDASANVATAVPTFRPRAKINVQWGSEPELATDNPYGDVDLDGVPEAAVGRLSVATAEELSRVLQRILRYEQTTHVDLTRRQVHVVAGGGGLGVLADAAIEAAAKTILCQYIPPAYDTTLTYASSRSPYCPSPALFRNTALCRLHDGGLFWVYTGHGQRDEVDGVHVPGGGYPIMRSSDLQPRSEQATSPVAVFLACYTGAYDGSRDCLAERLLRTPGGPVAVLAGSRVTMPYGMCVLATEMLDEHFLQRRTTLGELLLQAKRNMVLRTRNDPRSQMFDSVAMAVHPGAAQLAEERAEHVLMFNLLGDPLLRLRHAQRAEVQVIGELQSGRICEVQGSTEIATGEATVELIVERGRLTFTPAPRTEYDPSNTAQQIQQQVYQRANDTRLATTLVPVVNGRFSAQLTVPASVRGSAQVRVFIRGDNTFAVGSAEVEIKASTVER